MGGTATRRFPGEMLLRRVSDDTVSIAPRCAVPESEMARKPLVPKRGASVFQGLRLRRSCAKPHTCRLYDSRRSLTSSRFS